jgi:hypothetical protein
LKAFQQIDMDENERKYEIKVDLMAGFVSFKFLPPPFSVGHNNLNPKLILREDGLEFRGAFFTTDTFYKNIEKAGCSVSANSISLFRMNMVRFSFDNTIFTFSGNVKTLDGLKQVWIFLENKGCPLSARVKQLLK